MPLITNVTGTRNLRFGFTPSSVRANYGGRRLYDDLGSNIDIMVVWTMAAECGMSGLAYPCAFTTNTELKMLGEINLAVAVTNTAFVESGIASQLRLVHAYRHPTYIEVDTNRNGAALSSFRTDASVRAQRFLYGADLVSVVVGKCRRDKLNSTTPCNIELTRCPSFQPAHLTLAAEWDTYLIGHGALSITCTQFLATAALHGVSMMCFRMRLLIL
jgi:hypothetical protein